MVGGNPDAADRNNGLSSDHKIQLLTKLLGLSKAERVAAQFSKSCYRCKIIITSE